MVLVVFSSVNDSVILRGRWQGKERTRCWQGRDELSDSPERKDSLFSGGPKFF